MTDREAHRKACLKAMDEALYARTGTRMSYTTIAFIFDSLHSIARVNPVEPTKEMVGVELHSDELDCRPTPRDLCIIFDTMSAAGDLTNTPERKP